MMTDRNVYLDHHGIKGMKWGVRKRSGSSGSGTSAPSPHAHLSNEELRKHIERMNLEQQYSKLSAPKKDHSESAAFVKGLGKNVVSAAVMAVATHQIASVMKKVTK